MALPETQTLLEGSVSTRNGIVGLIIWISASVVCVWAAPNQGDLENRKAAEITTGTPADPVWAGSRLGKPIKPQIYGLVLRIDSAHRIIFGIIPSFGRPISLGLQTIQDTVLVTIDKPHAEAKSHYNRLPADSFHLFITQTDSTGQYISLADTARYFVARKADSLLVTVLKRYGFIELEKGAFDRIGENQYLAIGRKEKSR